MVSQATKYATLFIPILSFWLVLVLDFIPGWKITATPFKQLILLAPIFAVFAFGIYCLFSLYVQVNRFKDRPDEAEKLKKEIEEAKADLRDKGVKID